MNAMLNTTTLEVGDFDWVRCRARTGRKLRTSRGRVVALAAQAGGYSATVCLKDKRDPHVLAFVELPSADQVWPGQTFENASDAQLWCEIVLADLLDGVPADQLGYIQRRHVA
jgi:hypothetical protein